MTIVGVVLAAGSSNRLGRPKQAILFRGETLVARAVRVAAEAGLAKVIVVARVGDELGCDVVENEQAGEGIASSIRCGVAAAREMMADGVVLMTCDQIALSSAHVRKLIEEPGQVTGSAYAGRVGIPAYFPASCFDELMKLQGESGARELLREASAVMNEALSFDVDTEVDVEKLAAMG